MKKLLSRLFGGREEAAREITKAAAREALQAPSLVLRTDATVPIVDWEAMEPCAPVDVPPARLDEFWTVTAKAWLEALGSHLGDHYTVRESERFLLLSALEERAARPVLEYAEKTRKRILRVLDGIAADSEVGKLCILIFEDGDRYYEYVANYGPEEGEFAASGGMFLQYGYGHFVFVQDHMSAIEPTIAHELTHSMVQHLPLPAWLNEGIAVNTEHRLSPPPGRPLHTPEEMHEKHVAFWNEATIQEFWSGKSWRRPDEGNSLSYDLARNFVSMTANDFKVFRAFVNAADWADAGDAAAREHLGYPLTHLAEAILGDGPWQPLPEKWKEGIEQGQFRNLTKPPAAPSAAGGPAAARTTASDRPAS